MKKLIFALTLSYLLLGQLGLSPRAQAQCVMCKAQVEAAKAENDDYDVAGLNKGIVYMMIVPYILMGTIGYFWYRRTHPKRATAA